jgi:hypothetical protein
MEIVNIQKGKTISIDTTKAEVHIAYTAKITVKIQGKEVEVVERLWKILPLRYNSDNAVKNLELIEYTMNTFENEMNEIVEKIKKTFDNLEKILEKYGYQVI